jgi:hypothetical protein
MGKSKDKGNRFELECAKKLREVFPDVVSARLMSRDADNRGVDLVRTGDYAFQTKHYATNTPNDWKVIGEMNTKDIKVYVKKTDRKRALAVIDFEDFINLLK